MRTILTLISLFSSSSIVSAQSLSGVESVEYDPVNNRYLASSDGTSIVVIAPNGTLSYFGSGLVADYGMEVVGNTLFAITGTRIKGYDLTTTSIVMDLNIVGAQFLNGLASDGANRLWATAFNGYSIYEIDITSLSSPTYSMVAGQAAIGTTNKPNGIVYDGANNRVVFVNWGTNAPIKAMDLTTYAVTTLIANTGLGNIDGIARDGQGRWYVSSWSPARITRYASDFTAPETITVPGINSPADICYATATDTLAIPGGNQVLFVGFENEVVGVTDISAPRAQVRYAPSGPQVQFTLSKHQVLRMDLLDLSGRHVLTVMDGPQPSGAHRVLLNMTGLASGTYLCRISSEELRATERFIVP